MASLKPKESVEWISLLTTSLCINPSMTYALSRSPALKTSARPGRSRCGLNPGAVGSVGARSGVAQEPGLPGSRGRPAIGQQFSFGPPGESVDHAGASRKDHLHPEVFQ